MSFAPLAGRLAAQAAELRPVAGSRDTLAKLMALVMCAVLEMLIVLCEMLDARAAAGARPVAVTIPALRTACQSRSSGGRARPLNLVPVIRAVAPRGAGLQSRTGDATLSGPWLAWSRDDGPIRSFSFPTEARSENETFPSVSRHVKIVTIT